MLYPMADNKFSTKDDKNKFLYLITPYNSLYTKHNQITKRKKKLPKVKPSVLINALLHITIETDETTDKVSAPIVPSCNRWPSLIFTDTLKRTFSPPKISIYA